MKDVFFERRKPADRDALLRNVTSLQEQMARAFPLDHIVGTAPAFTTALSEVLHASRRESPVLLVGEHGTGRELLARLIHSAGARADEPFVPAHCAALPAADMQKELFGTEENEGAVRRGLFDVAGPGTLYLHEVHQLDRSTQGRLVAVLEHGEFRRVRGTSPMPTAVRVIGASRLPMEDLTGSAHFRPDFLRLLGATVVHVPPLRERREDVPILARHYLQRFRRSASAVAEDFSQDALDLLVRYPWPGNIRELRNVIERALVLHRHAPIIRAAHLPPEFHELDRTQAAIHGNGSLSQAVNEFERRLVERALLETGGVQTRAAALLGTTRRVLKYRMEKLNISVP